MVVSPAGGDADDAVRLMLADKMEELMRIQVEAIKNMKIDKVTVWDGGAGQGWQNRHRRLCLRPDEEHPAHERAVRHGRHELAGVFGH